jgi:dinuclear metal center YbgI/SA1388 family protein
MPSVADVATFLDRFAPARLAAEWDNVGLLIGDRQRPVERLMTCLTVTPQSVAEAIDEGAQLIVTHHPFPFHAARRFTSDTVEGRLMLDIVSGGIAVYSPHTSFDSASDGINQRLGAGMGLSNLAPLVADGDDATAGTGRQGTIDGANLAELGRRCAAFLNVAGVQVVGAPDLPVKRVAVACGSAGELLEVARQAGCDCFVTGEARFHGCLQAEAYGMSLILTGHFASERFAVEALAKLLSREFPAVFCWASSRESDPVRWLSRSVAS